jgi:outer membrane protein assembly factor BamD (BamD/ComL family)
MLAQGHWDRARRLCRQEGDTLGWTGSLRDRFEVLSAAVALPQPLSLAWTTRLRLYLHALNLSDTDPDCWNEAQETFERLHNDTAAGFLREHALYQAASLAYAWLDFPRALRLYQQLLREFPHSPKREAALIMVARSGLLPKTPEGRNIPEAKRALERLDSDFPQSRFHRAALGLRARLAYLTGDYGSAVDLYLKLDDLPSVEVVRKEMPRAAQERLYPRLLAAYLYHTEHATQLGEYEFAIHMVDETMQMLTPDGARAFVARMKAEPALAAPYFYYRLYYTDFEPQDSDDNEKEVRRAEQRKRDSLTNLARLADQIAAKHENALPPLVQVRLAEVYYQRHAYRDALRWTERALRDSAAGQEPYARALYVRGATRHKLHRREEAIVDFETLLRRCPDSPMRPGAREELAILREETGDLDAALDQYFALGYDNDVAYLLDARMPTGAVAAYLAGRPHHPRRDLLRYSLGIRYLRDDDLSSAHRWLRRVPQKVYFEYGKGRREYEWLDTTSPDPLTVIDQLVALREAIGKARSRESKATAAYRYASYHYKNGTLLFYNAALWNGRRAWLFDTYWNKRQETSADTGAVRRHMYAHEVYAHTRVLCEHIAREYPDTPAAPLALYRAACCAHRLADFNGWWREEDNRSDLERQAILLMRRMARRYPKHPLAHYARKYAAVFADERASARTLNKQYAESSPDTALR